MMEKVDIAIIGAGVVGLALAYSISRQRNRSVAVLEKNRTYGLDTSSRNSQVIHSGIYYPSSMLKTQFCIEGRQKLYDFCRAYQVDYNPTGKLVLACHPAESGKLEELRQQGQANGVKLKLLSAKERQQLEPSIYAFEALLVPESGILDVHQLMQRLYLLSGLMKSFLIFTPSLSNWNTPAKTISSPAIGTNSKLIP
ncbi:MAG: FAD-dependent oxidoreductase [Syntrophomonadaceae bacterium]|nr:FAD-dependent oxidoreductase [Syntrophomonadaceae bacterium]